MPRINAVVTKEYPSRGPMQQFRIETPIAFHCFRCNSGKTSRLLTLYNKDWGQILCNGCYGRLLSIYNIKAGVASDEEKTEELANLLLSILKDDGLKHELEKLRISEKKSSFLSSPSLRFIATSQYVSAGLSADANLDWSPAIIGICKAFESEIVNRIFVPLKSLLEGSDFAQELQDKDLSRVAKYCNGTSKAPELGVIAYFLQVCANSKERVNSSVLLKGLIGMINKWPKSNWLFSKEALHAVQKLTMDYRNKAAHIDDLTQTDFKGCHDLVLGNKGIMWHLVAATDEKSFIY